MNIKEYLQQHPQWKKRIHGFIMHPVKTRPYWWIRVWQPFYIKKGQGSVIYPSVRKDLPPFHLFQMGKYSVVEDFSCLNNAVGDIVIGDYCRIGLSNTVIGPIRIDNGVNISQNVALDRIRSQLSEYHSRHHRTRYHHFPYPHRRTYHHRSQRDCTARNHHRQTLFYRCRVCGYPKHTRLLCHGRKSRTHYQTL